MRRQPALLSLTFNLYSPLLLFLCEMYLFGDGLLGHVELCAHICHWSLLPVQLQALLGLLEPRHGFNLLVELLLQAAREKTWGKN